jgi:hypothetical protein
MFARSGVRANKLGVTGVTSFAAKARWYRRALGVNPLIRLTDRLEAFAVLAVIATALGVVPAASSAETMVYDAGVRTSQEQTHARHSVDALVVDGEGVPTDLNTPAYVQARWQEGTHTRTESVVGPATVQPGDRMTVWLDESGKVVAAPLRVGDAKVNSMVAAGTLWITVVVLAALVAFGIRRGLDRTRARSWERELRVLAHS